MGRSRLVLVAGESAQVTSGSESGHRGGQDTNDNPEHRQSSGSWQIRENRAMRFGPELELPDGPAAGPVVDVQGDVRAMCRMTGGAWQLVRVVAWQRQHDGRWRCLLTWGVRGVVHEDWYVYDPRVMTPAGPVNDGSAPL